MYFKNRTNRINFQGHRSTVKVTGSDYRIFNHYETGQKSLYTR